MEYLIKYTKTIKQLIFLFLFLSSVLVTKNNLQHNITNWHIDEINTMNYGISSLYSGEVSTLRVGESTRWLARAIYPVGLYYMNSHMGGVHPEVNYGWRYSSGYYIQRHFDNPKSIESDPNLQDFTFAMKFVLSTLVILSFLFASYFLCGTYGFIAGISYFVFAISTPLISSMQSIFYTESSLIILFNMVIVLALMKKINTWRFYLYTALILAFAISTKLTGVMFVIPILTIILVKGKSLKGLRIEAFVVLTILFVALIHVYATSYMEVLDQTMSNIYHFKTGHYKSFPSGIHLIKLIVSSLSPWLFIFPVALVFIWIKKVTHLPFLLSIAALALIITVALTGTDYFQVRNLTVAIVIMIAIFSIGLAYLIRLSPYKPEMILGVSIVAVLLLHTYETTAGLYSVDHELISSYTKGSKSIATIDVEEGLVDNATELESMPETFTMSKEIAKLKAQFSTYECVVIKRVKKNKHYTNYILPQDFTLIARHGNYFVYKNLNKRISSLTNETLLKSAKFDIHLENNMIILYKKECGLKDIKAKFFLHVFPENIEDLPEEKRIYKIDNLDFKPSSNSIFNGSYFIEKDLPKYPIQAIHVGQFDQTGRLWEEKIIIND
jgi:hypothetical protein